MIHTDVLFIMMANVIFIYFFNLFFYILLSMNQVQTAVIELSQLLTYLGKQCYKLVFFSNISVWSVKPFWCDLSFDKGVC